MMASLDEFKGSLPYASVIFGVYQPLLGWKAKQTKMRLNKERTELVRHAFHSIMQDSLSGTSSLSVQDIASLGGIYDNNHNTSKIPVRVPKWLRSQISNSFESTVLEFREKNGHLPASDEWSKIVEDANLKTKVDSLASNFSSVAVTELSGSNEISSSPLFRESLVVGMFDYLGHNAPETLSALFASSEESRESLIEFVDPLRHFDPQTQQAFLSPVGIVNLYRQYFFELNTFLGSPVGHVWISPGGSVELFEVTTRRTITERQIERSMEAITRSETFTMQQDDVSDAVKDENQQNIEMGVTASGQANWGVYQAEASGSLGYQSTTQSSAEIAHKNTRQQSERISSEIRKNFKTTFRSTVDVQDTSSRRHEIKNSTDKLVNYEFRRKMRRVAVQVQHIGTFLCWQVYIDEPGQHLGVAELVHVAKPDDLDSSIQPPEGPPVLRPKEENLTFDFPYQMTRDNGERPESDYYEGLESEEDGSEWSGRTKIVWERDYEASPPGPGYTLASVTVTGWQGSTPGKRQPATTPRVSFKENKFKLSLPYVTFGESNNIRFAIKLLWNPPNQSGAQAEYQNKLKEYTEAKRREAHAQYVSAIRERIKLASNVAPRPSDDLREEERIVIFRRLIQQLMGTESSEQQSLHVTSELIRSIFDVDRILYYVAPDWWMPRKIYRQQLVTPGGNPSATPAPAASTFGSMMGGEMAMMRRIDRDDTSGDGGGPIGDNDNCPPRYRKDRATGECLPMWEGEDGPRGPIGRPGSPQPSPAPTPPGQPAGGAGNEASPPTPLTEGDTIGWGGIRQKGRNNYLITEDSEPAPLGASIGWLIQLDGDNHRNAFLNSPWVKAVVPIRPGKERDALQWLKSRGVEGVEGLNAEYDGPGVEHCDRNEHGGGGSGPITIECVLNGLAKKIKEHNMDINNTMATETVFERGFNPLEGGFRAPSKPFEIFDQWIEVLPTDQVVAVEYNSSTH
jgi:hypothetical protein